MEFDINEVLADMISAIKNTVEDNWDEVKSISTEFLELRKGRLELLVEFRLKGEISQEIFEDRLADEEKIAEAELHAVVAISKAIAQKAANAAIDVLKKAVKIALETAL